MKSHMAHRKLGQKPRAHTKQKTQAHGQQTNHQPWAKQDMTHAANEKTHKPRVFTRHDNMKACSQWIYKLRATQHKIYTNARTLTQRDRTWCVGVRTPSRNRNSRHECRDPNTTLQHETRHADERAHLSTLEAAHSHETHTWREYQGSVTNHE